jgi:tetratricopeptide (TPR) repeat protein
VQEKSVIKTGQFNILCGCMLNRCLVVAVLLVLMGCVSDDLKEGRTFLELEDWPRALDAYDRAVREDPQSVEARLGLALTRMGWARDRQATGQDSVSEWLLAARDFAIVSRLDSTASTAADRADAYFQACLWWQRHGQEMRASWAARRAQEVDPRHAASAQLLGTVAQRQGNELEARRWFERALDADSTFLPAYASLTMLAMQHRDFEGAALYLKEGLRLDPDDGWFQERSYEVCDSLGWDDLP